MFALVDSSFSTACACVPLRGSSAAHGVQQRLLGRSEGRSDDNPETMRKRFKVYQEQTMPVIERYRAEGKLKQVPADRSPEEVFEDVQKIIEDLGGARTAVAGSWCTLSAGHAVHPLCKLLLTLLVAPP